MEQQQAHTTRGRRPSARDAKRAVRAAQADHSIPYITRKIPCYEVLDEEGLALIERNADTILEEIGIEFREDAEALEIWKTAGADVQGERVRMPRGMCRQLIQASAPREFTQHARNPARSVPILIHGDAAFPGQGIVAETLNLSRLPGYRTGGTIHMIVNNQLGFTTSPRDEYSTSYASGLARGFKIPIVHVNADDPESCVEAARLAFAYRERFQRDFLIDLIGYRRHGHNEGDEPAFTQPRCKSRSRRIRQCVSLGADVISAGP